MTGAEVVDLYVDSLPAGTKAAVAWQLDNWCGAHADSNVRAWKGYASQALQQHSIAQAYWGGTGTRHRLTATRRGPWAPWMIEHDGSWAKALDLKLLQVARDNLVHNARHALPMAKAEDVRHGHVKAKLSSPDGPVLKACKKRIQAVAFGINSSLVVAGLEPIDIPALLAKY